MSASSKRSLAVPLGALALALALIGGAATASAAEGQARVRLAYLSPDMPNADFYVDGQRAWSNVAYKTVSTYLGVSGAQHTFQIRPAGSAAGATPLAEIQQSLDANGYYTVMAADRGGTMHAAIFSDGFPNPPAGKAVARFVHTAPEVPGVDVALKNGPVLFPNISFLQGSSYAPISAGSYDLVLNQAGTNNVLFSTTAVVSGAGSVRTLVGAGGLGRPVELIQVLDASSAGVAPQGGAATGEGGATFGGVLPLALIVCSLAGTALLAIVARWAASSR